MSNTTSLTLLGQLQSAVDHEAWARFAQLYTPLLYYWCRRANLQQHDAADLVQDVFVVLVHKLPEFQYDHQRSFRSWLRTVTLNKWRERQRRRALQPAVIGDEAAQVPICSDDWELEEVEYRRQLVRAALPLIEPEFSASAWQAFLQHVINGDDASAVAARLGISVGTVYAAKSRILNRLRVELAGFLED